MRSVSSQVKGGFHQAVVLDSTFGPSYYNLLWERGEILSDNTKTQRDWQSLLQTCTHFSMVFLGNQLFSAHRVLLSTEPRHWGNL